MRIIAGKWRGRAIAAPKGQATRPTSDRAREALFSMLASRVGSFEGLQVADIFAGSGALGLEALSRGAAHCVFVDNDRAALDAIRANLDALGGDGDIRAGAAERIRLVQPLDLVFLDPPYGSGLALTALANLPVAPGGFASIETARDETVEMEGFEKEVERVYGKAKISLLRRTP
ncbi:16S rRNA (guanine(966)-N(2))-methyltransferase RsmD [Sphingosinicella sp. BN140058]|uniref:16S rRNA (guanine(966)-N(2))-methyltransferase RsmD n=1 Tax=Sphingosinicella sp. BN140058 TaxID=1892855 RepID=UPI001010BE70|nr:16S rRNA (guanine(966)-N(2))-methyltransferase RsmD [Sphingosinicella sp. BN140058]QAY78826.1 16S rRNA (guanine(966)-N(2))-methyltransferase RsmD [Sphingosinicella sp. BN140058]